MPARNLKTLSDKELLLRIRGLARKERLTTLEILLHLGEVDRRKLYLKLGYGTLFDYCTKHLKYSSSAAGRRIHAARCVRRFPEVSELFEKSRMNLMTVSAIAGILDESNKTDLLPRVVDRTQREVEAVVAEYRPVTRVPERVKPVCLRVRETTPQNRTSTCAYSQTGSGKSPNCSAVEPEEKPTFRIERKMLLQFAASPAFMQKLEEARSLLSHKLGPDASLEEIFDAALETLLDKHSPKRREQRRANRKRVVAMPSANPRQISKPIRDKIFQRDRNQCAYVSPTGQRCSATRLLQIDHIVPVARGGTNAFSNLRLLCVAHNKLEAERILGANAASRYRHRE
jgi:5-methylcytosine-specific restriction protein A